MKGVTLGRQSLSICTMVTLACCSGWQPSNGAAGLMPQNPSNGAVRSTAGSALPASFAVLHHFSPFHADGEYPVGNLTDIDGTMYGATEGGGKFHDGAIYATSKAGAEKAIYSFRDGDDGAFPYAGPIDMNGTLYGTTFMGGASSCDGYNTGCGVIYSATTSGGEKVLHRFGGGSDGANPVVSLTEMHGTLYGVTNAGGSGSRCSGGCGVFFSISSSGVEKVLYSFQGGADGADPDASLIDVNGTLYGTTYLGGGSGCYNGYGCGTVYSISPTGVEKVLYSFTGGSDGEYPEAALFNANGTLYGTTTAGGGSSDCGTVYSLDTAGSEKVLHRFKGRFDGCFPDVALIEVKGMLYGATTMGGPARDGTVYSITTAGEEKVLHHFSGSDGVYPQSALRSLNGDLFGAAYYGGSTKGCSNGCGVLYALTP